MEYILLFSVWHVTVCFFSVWSNYMLKHSLYPHLFISCLLQISMDLTLSISCTYTIRGTREKRSVGGTERPVKVEQRCLAERRTRPAKNTVSPRRTEIHWVCAVKKERKNIRVNTSMRTCTKAMVLNSDHGAPPICTLSMPILFNSGGAPGPELRTTTLKSTCTQKHTIVQQTKR